MKGKVTKVEVFFSQPSFLGVIKKWLFLGLKARNVIARAVANSVSGGLGKHPKIPSPVSGENH